MPATASRTLSPPVSLLRRPHDRHRELPTRYHPTLSAKHTASRDQDRHLMTTMLKIATPKCCSSFAPATNPRRRRSFKSATPIPVAQSKFTARCRQTPRREAIDANPSRSRSQSTAPPSRQILTSCGQIPIATAAPPTSPNRGFLPWRLSDAGRLNSWHRRARPASETLHRRGLGGNLARRQLQPDKRTARGAERRRADFVAKVWRLGGVDFSGPYRLPSKTHVGVH